MNNFDPSAWPWAPETVQFLRMLRTIKTAFIVGTILAWVAAVIIAVVYP